MDHPMGLKALEYFDTLFADDEAIANTSDTLIVEQIKAFDGYGAKTETHISNGIRYFVNEYWTSGQRRAHSIHEVSYRACFKPQLPEFFIRRLTGPGDVVLDPFMGRGTTPVEAHLLGRKCVGNDINPLSVLLTRPRLNVPTYKQVQIALAEIDWEQKVEEPWRSASRGRRRCRKR